MNELQLGSFEDMEGMKPRFWPGESRQASWRSWHDLVQEGQVELGTETLEKVFKEMDHWKQGLVGREPEAHLMSVRATCVWRQGIHQGGQWGRGLEGLVSHAVPGLTRGSECGLYSGSQ